MQEGFPQPDPTSGQQHPAHPLDQEGGVQEPLPGGPAAQLSASPAGGPSADHVEQLQEGQLAGSRKDRTRCRVEGDSSGEESGEEKDRVGGHQRGKRVHLLTSKVFGVAQPHKPRIGPEYQAVIPPFRGPATQQAAAAPVLNLRPVPQPAVIPPPAPDPSDGAVAVIGQQAGHTHQ